MPLSPKTSVVSSLVTHFDHLIQLSSPTRTLPPVLTSPAASPTPASRKLPSSSILTMASTAPIELTPVVEVVAEPAAPAGSAPAPAPEQGETKEHDSSAPAAAAATSTPPPADSSPIARIVALLPSLSDKEQAIVAQNLERIGTYSKNLPLSRAWSKCKWKLQMPRFTGLITCCGFAR